MRQIQGTTIVRSQQPVAVWQPKRVVYSGSGTVFLPKFRPSWRVEATGETQK